VVNENVSNDFGQIVNHNYHRFLVFKAYIDLGGEEEVLDFSDGTATENSNVKKVERYQMCRL
jgi:hypothetical protein